MHNAVSRSVRLCDDDVIALFVPQVTAVVEKVLEVDAESYTFEAIFTVGFAWEEDRMWHVLPKATADELDACPEHQRCGDCTFENGEACAARMAWDNTNPRRPQ